MPGRDGRLFDHKVDECLYPGLDEGAVGGLPLEAHKVNDTLYMLAFDVL